MRILVADDDPQISGLLKRGLSYEGYAVDVAADGAEALAKTRDDNPDLVILDVMMPGIDGFEVARRLRQANKVPILMLTARGSVADRVAGLDSGADDYLIKPFDFDELLARVRALLRRGQTELGTKLRFGDLALDTSARQVIRGTTLVELTAKEFDLLELFMRHPRQVLRREQVYDKVWGYDFGGESNVIEVYVRYLRAKLEEGGLPRVIHTVRGVGYVLRDQET